MALSKDELIARLESQRSSDKEEIGRLVTLANKWKAAYIEAEDILFMIHEFVCKKRENRMKKMRNPRWRPKY